MEDSMLRTVDHLKSLQSMAKESREAYFSNLSTKNRIEKIALANVVIEHFDNFIVALIAQDEEKIEYYSKEREVIALVATEVLLEKEN